MVRAIACLVLAMLAGCTSNAARIDADARAAGLARYEAAGGLRTTFYLKEAVAGEPLLVYIEGDGVPWLGGVEPNDDPATRDPIALELLKRSPSGAYIVRPCYDANRDMSCTTEHWTGARYSEEIVGSMTAAVRDAMQRANAPSATLIGYSGGGVLALLIAERLTNARGVITIAANLDVEAWTRHHRYLPLTRSLNPARSTRAHPWPELHLQGARDNVAPPATTQAYFGRYPSAQRRLIEDYDHVCCWVENWPALLRQMKEKISTGNTGDTGGGQ